MRGFVPPQMVSPQWAALLSSALIFGAFEAAVRHQLRVWRVAQAGRGWAVFAASSADRASG